MTAFQSTRPRGARRDESDDGKYRAIVSIHAPARGATEDPQLEKTSRQVSIHAPARGATWCVLLGVG